jgi:hypothetical protein
MIAHTFVEDEGEQMNETYEFPLTWETTDAEDTVTGSVELIIHFRVLKGYPATWTEPGEADSVDVFNVTEPAWTLMRDSYQRTVDEATYDAVCCWVDQHEDRLLESAASDDFYNRADYEYAKRRDREADARA